MTQSGHTPRRSAPHGPKRRDDSTHPTGTRRGVERRPYPTASTTTRVSPAKPGPASARSQSRGSTSTPTPATVWTAGPAPIDLDAAWPTPIVEKIVGAFSEPGGRVALLPWPSARPTPGERPRLTPVFSDGVLNHAPGAEPDGEVTDALAAIEGLHRTVRVVHVPTDPAAIGRRRDRSGPILSTVSTTRPRPCPRRRVQTCAAGCSTARRPRQRTPT